MRIGAVDWLSPPDSVGPPLLSDKVADADGNEVSERPAHPGPPRRDDVADRFVVARREEFIEHAVDFRQLALDAVPLGHGPEARPQGVDRLARLRLARLIARVTMERSLSL